MLLCHRLQGWNRFTTGHFSLTAMHGNHLWPLGPPHVKEAWLHQVVKVLQGTMQQP